MAKLFELPVRIEYQRRPRKAARGARAARVQADDEESNAGEAERKLRILRIAADGPIPSVVRRVTIVEQLQRLPEVALERRFVGRVGPGEARDVRAERLAERRQFAGKREQIAREPRGRGLGAKR